MTIELLESEGVDDYDEVKEFVARARGHGCSIAIDDFGSGYSSLLHVLKLKVDNLKIDGTLIRDLEHDRHARILV